MNILENNPELLKEMLSSILSHVIFELCKNQWSVSRPFLPLIIFNQEHFKFLQQEVVNQAIQTAADTKQAERMEVKIHKCFNDLMVDVEMSIDQRYRDKFTQNLTVFRREMIDAMKGSDGREALTSGGCYRQVSIEKSGMDGNRVIVADGAVLNNQSSVNYIGLVHIFGMFFEQCEIFA